MRTRHEGGEMSEANERKQRRTECGFCDDGVAVIAGKPQPCPYCEAER